MSVEAPDRRGIGLSSREDTQGYTGAEGKFRTFNGALLLTGRPDENQVTRTLGVVDPRTQEEKKWQKARAAAANRSGGNTPQDPEAYRESAMLSVDFGLSVVGIDKVLKKVTIDGGVGKEAFGDLVEEISVKIREDYDPQAIQDSREKIVGKRGKLAGYREPSKEIEDLLRRKYRLMYGDLGDEGSGFVQPEEAAKMKTRYHKELMAILTTIEEGEVHDVGSKIVHNITNRVKNRGGVPEGAVAR